MRRTVLVSSLLTVLILGSISNAFAPKTLDPAKRQQLPVVILKVGEQQTIQHQSRKKLRTIDKFNSRVVRVGQAGGDPTTLRLNADKEGGTRIELVDEDGQKETLVILVEAADAK